MFVSFVNASLCNGFLYPLDSAKRLEGYKLDGPMVTIYFSLTTASPLR